MATSQVLQHLYSLDTSSPDFLRCLYCLIRSDEEEQHLSTLQGSELTRLVDFLDDILDVAPITDDVSRRCLHKLRTICSQHAILPSYYTISGDLSRVGDHPFALGGFSEVWKGTYNGRKVCIKHPRVSEKIREAVEKAFYKEAVTWKRLEHPNVVAFIGVTQNPLQLVSEWMPNGTITEYANENPGANRVGLLLDVAEGLDYLHANHTTHGDLKGSNILVDRGGHACLTDFGLASVVRGLSSVLVTKVQGYTERWAAPEVLWSGDRNTQEADVFAFGMVVVELFTGKCPFSEFTSMVAVAKIMDGERPDRPQEAGLTDLVWEATCTCWRQNPVHRPTMAKVVGILRECYMPYAADLHLTNASPLRLVKWPTKAKNIDPATMPFCFPIIYQHINKVAQELATTKDGLEWDNYDQFLKLCTFFDTIPASYELGGVMKQGDRAQHVSGETEIWKGVYDSGVVALKVIRVPQLERISTEPYDSWSREVRDICMAKSRFCKGAVLMKRLKHVNILPFYGVSTTIFDFSLVFPWYNNGNIKHYLERNPGVDRYDLLSGAVEGLRFLHSNGVVHGALRPSHILIDDDGNARLIIDPGVTSRASSSPLFYGDRKYPGYSAPELFGFGETRTAGSDVYVMALIMYEVLTGIVPYWEYRPRGSPSEVVGGIPVRPHGMLDDLVWGLLEKCWSKTPEERPPVAEVYHTLKSCPKVIPTSRSRSAIGELPGRFKLHVHSIKTLGYWPSKQPIYVKFKYRDRDYLTSPAPINLERLRSEYTWSSSENWVIETDEQCHGQLVSLELLTLEDEVCAKGDFSLINSANKNITVALGVSVGLTSDPSPFLNPPGADVKILVIAM